MFCIDFGSSYTKVALRTDANEEARLVWHADNSDDDAAFCFPSAVLVDTRGPAPRYGFGAETSRQAVAPGVEVRRNWKPDLFTAPEAAPVVQEEGLEALLNSADFQALVRRYRVPAQDVAALTTLYRTAAGLFAARPAAGGPGRAAGPRPPAAPLLDMAVAYFRDLRRKVLETSERLLRGIDPAAIPARVCVPAFFGAREADVPPETRDLFLSILNRAGWPTDPDRPLVTEPVANVIGVISKGANVTWRPYPNRSEEHAHLGKMFQHGPLVKAYRAELPEYAVLVCDVGSYTTDFALIRFRTREAADERPAVTQQSVPLGIAALDDRVRSALPSDKGRWWDATSGRRRELCKRALYVDRKAYATVEVGDVGTPEEQAAVGDCLDAFGGELARICREFCDRHDLRRCHEVVLTGGGNHVPALRNGLLAGIAGRYGTGYLVRVPPGTPTRSEKAVLTPEQVRAGSALGGCSVYFDGEFN
jgi:hypothetical protein